MAGLAPGVKKLRGGARERSLSFIFVLKDSIVSFQDLSPDTTAQDRPLRNAFSQFPQSPEWNMPLIELRTVGKTQIDQELPVIFASQQITMTQ